MGSKTSKVRRTQLSGCLAVGFFGIFAAAGALSFYFLAVKPIAGLIDAMTWVETECVIVSSRVAENHSSDGSTYSVDITYTYERDSRSYRGDRYDFSVGSSSGYSSKAEVVDSHPPGAEVGCYVDPDDPTRSVIDRSPGHFLWWSLFPLPFLAVGLGGIAFFLFSGGNAESARRRRGVASTRGRRGPRTRRAGRTAGTRPTAGSAPPRGPIELEAGVAPLAKLIGVSVFATLWNAVVGAFVFFTIIPSFARGDPEWFLTLFMTPFAAIGVVTVGGVAYQFLAMFNPRPRLTLAGPLTPGAEGELSWQLGGPAGRVQSLTLELEGREAARYRRGKNSRTDHHVFHSSQVLAEGPLSRFGARHGGRVALRVPEPTMPSFDAGNNRIEWRLKVRGDIPVWPDLIQDFPLTVFPARGSNP